MAKIKCYNCRKVTPVVAPRYRCNFCNYPLKKYVEQPEEPTPQLQDIGISLPPPAPKVEEKVEFKPEPRKPEYAGKVIAGWLIVHTENKAHTSYELYEGENIIGRPDSHDGVTIPIKEDEYISRVHSTITVTKDYLHRFHYIMVDGEKDTYGKASTNGVYINGIEERLPKGQLIFLKDGDTIQVGLTKLVFKNTDMAFDIQSAANSVIGTDFTNTVAIRR